MSTHNSKFKSYKPKNISDVPDPECLVRKYTKQGLSCRDMTEYHKLYYQKNKDYLLDKNKDNYRKKKLSKYRQTTIDEINKLNSLDISNIDLTTIDLTREEINLLLELFRENLNSSQLEYLRSLIN